MKPRACIWCMAACSPVKTWYKRQSNPRWPIVGKPPQWHLPDFRDRVLTSMMKQHFPSEIETKRLILRKHALKLAPRMYSAIDSDRNHLGQYLPWVEFTSCAEDEASFIYECHRQWDQFEMYDYSMFLKQDDSFLGNVGVHSLAWLGAKCEVGYWLLSSFEGQGFVTEAVQMLVQQAAALGFLRVEIRCALENKKSVGVPKRLGFKFEGQLHQATMVRGRPQDVLVYVADFDQGQFRRARS